MLRQHDLPAKASLIWRHLWHGSRFRQKTKNCRTDSEADAASRSDSVLFLVRTILLDGDLRRICSLDQNLLKRAL